MLNKFQLTVRDAALVVFKGFNLSVEFTERGVQEGYLYAGNNNLSVELWIYTDEVEYSIGGHHVIFEKQEFDSAHEMIDLFIKSISNELSMI